MHASSVSECGCSFLAHSVFGAVANMVPHFTSSGCYKAKYAGKLGDVLTDAMDRRGGCASRVYSFCVWLLKLVEARKWFIKDEISFEGRRR